MVEPAKKSVSRSGRGFGKRRGPRTVTMRNLAAKLSEDHEMSRKETEAVLGDLITQIKEHLKKGNRVRMGELGILRVGKRARTVGRNPASQFRVRKKGAGKYASYRAAEKVPSVSAYEPTENAYEPSARALALLRGKEIAESDLKRSGGSFSLREVQTLLGISRQSIDKKVRENALIAVPGPHGRRRYPAVQFISGGTLSGLQRVLKNLPSANGWFHLNFLITPDAHLGGRRPIDLLKEGKIDPVITAAKAVGVQGA
jgi:nucleoid DNA-binding protein